MSKVKFLFTNKLNLNVILCLNDWMDWTHFFVFNKLEPGKFNDEHDEIWKKLIFCNGNTTEIIFKDYAESMC